MSGPDTGPEVLESRYRRLLRLYPAAHRAAYGDEMLGVLLAGARPGQRRPSVADAADLLLSAGRVRLLRTAGALGGPAWREAAAVTGVLVAVFFVVVALQRLVPVARTVAVEGWTPLPGVYVEDWLRPVAWAVVVVAAVGGARRVAAGSAIVAVALEVGAVVRWYPDDPARVPTTGWLVVLATVAAASLVVAVRGRPGAAVADRRVVALAGAAGASAVTAALIDGQQSHFAGGLRDLSYAVSVNGVLHVRWALPPFLLAVVLAGLALRRLSPPVRRRLAVLLLPAASTLALREFAFGGFLYSNSWFPTPIHLTPAQWAGLIVTPVLAFAVGVVAVHRRERMLHIIELGRAAERRQRDAAPGTAVPPV